MSRLVLVLRLARRDLRRRSLETTLLLVAVAVATTTLTVGLVLHGEAAAPYAVTRAATAGPDVVAQYFPPPRTSVTAAQRQQLVSLVRQPGVTGHSGPFPVTWTPLRFGNLSGGAEVEGRDRAESPVDRPKLLSGGWVRPHGAVVERSFADALGVGVGDTIRLSGRPFRVVGTAVTAAFPSYPQLCTLGCILSTPALSSVQPGLVWLTRHETRALATTTEPLTYFENLALADPHQAPAFVARHGTARLVGAPALLAWQDIRARHAELLRNEQAILLLGSSLLGILAIATVAVLVGGRMTGELRRVGTLKAVGGSPGFVAAVLLAEYLAVALLAAGAGLLLGRVLAPVLTTPSAGLLGGAGSPPLTLSAAATVVAVAVAITVLATLVPAWRAARTSTVRALADAARTPRRGKALIALSAHLPAPLLVGLRIAARRPRRTILGACTIAIAICGMVVVMCAQTKLDNEGPGRSSQLIDPNAQRLGQVMLAVTILLCVMAVVNLVFIATATALDAQTSLAVTRALGATPAATTGALATAQALPAAAGVVLGIPAGLALFAALDHGGQPAMPPVWWLVSLGCLAVVVTAALTGIPARLGSRRPIAEILSAESG